jgi:SHS2 domain-containing protein
MSEAGFRVIDHTADAGIEAWGPDLPALFTNAALAVMTIYLDPGTIRTTREIKVHLAGDGLAELMVSWLNELIYLFDSEQLLLREFSFSNLDTGGVEATCRGERADRERHQLHTGIKAATYHELKLLNVDGTWHATVYLDL